ncbi:MAG: S-layer homology domain-containing protein [Defluviitaleaceae bacterium]|nr:S-layer homology domain-containing protein [Defluviitaleaceae bacterium]
MKKIIFCVTIFAAMLAFPVFAYARPHRIGDMGFHGGISESRHLPRTLETILLEQGNNNRARRRNRNDDIYMNYSEFIFLGINGEPLLFEGRLAVTQGAPERDSDAGTYRIRHRVLPPAGAGDDAEISITRTMYIDVEYARVGNQIIYSYIIDTDNWAEVITTPEGTFTLDPLRSSLVVSIWEDQTPAISFYRGDISARLVYVFVAGEGDDEGEDEGEDEDGVETGITIVEKTGEFYGFATAWSATETHRTDVTVTNHLGQALQYQIRPSVTVNKDLQFVHNEPTVITFAGNYREMHRSFAGLRYDIFVMPQSMQLNVPTYGTHSMETFNVFEQLPVPDLSFIEGHPAEDDIHRLFAMQILQGDPRFFVPNQAITRGQFLTALARTIKLPVEEVTPPTARRGQQPVAIMLFADVDSNRPEFRYIQAVQNAGIAFGRADGKFYFDYPISRQEAIAVTIRALGLTNLGANPTVVSPFIDSDDIAYWAIRDVNAAFSLDIIAPDEHGNLHPRRAMSKAEAAAMINHLLDYMRNGIVSHYSEQIVNITR